MLLTPAIAHRPPRVGILDGTRHGPLGARRAAGDRLRRAVERRRQPGGLGPVRASAADGLPPAVQLVGRTDDETTLLSLSAQIEAARPFRLDTARPGGP